MISSFIQYMAKALVLAALSFFASMALWGAA